jgi:hypothetical protein
MLQIGPLTSILYKSSVTVRGYYWRAAIEMFLANPVKGIGLDRYGAFFKEFREPGYPLKYGYEITSNNAHNVFLQLFSTGGIILGLSYLLLMLLILIVGLRNISLTSGDAQKINLLLLSSWIGFQAQSLISIDNIGISIWGWLIGGCILGLNNQNSIDEDFNFKIQGIKIQKNNIRVLQPLVSTSLLIPILFLSYNLNKIETNALIVKSLANSGLSENKKIVIDHANWVIKNRFADPYYKYVMALYMVDVGYETQSHKIIMDLSQEDPRNIDNLRWLAEYEKVNQNLLREIFYREKLADLGRLYIKHGDARLALNVKNRIMDFAPNSDIAIVAEKELIPIE